MKEEIIQLQQALEASPDNQMLRQLLMQKMIEAGGYSVEVIEHAKKLLAQKPGDIKLMEVLLVEYYQLGNFSTSIILLEDMDDVSLLSDKARAIVAKLYLKIDDVENAREVYQDLISDSPDFVDAELDDQFRGKVSTDDEDNSDGGYFLETPDINFTNVGGMDRVKKEIEMKIIKPLENAELFASYGKKIGGGILLYGPPGCGKTFIAKATAGEINAKFISIGLNDVLDMWLGNSEKNLHAYFELARRNTPCVIFIDEIDALGAKRSGLANSAGKNVVNQFLSELDGINSDNDGILIVGATNAPWDVDSAFRRPGRFDRIIFVPPPDEVSKTEIIKLTIGDKPHADIDYRKVSSKMKSYSGADINAAVDIAVESILEEAMRTGVPRPITTKDLLGAVKKHKASTVEWFSTAKNYALFSNKSGLYDDIVKYLNL